MKRKKQLGRFENHNPPPYSEIKGRAFTARDIDILQVLMRYPLLRSSWIWPFVKSYHRNYEMFIKRLKVLRKLGVIECPPEQEETRFEKHRLTLIYRITKNGHRILKDRGLTSKDYRPPSSQFGHQLAECEVIADIEIALLNHPTLRFINADEIMARAPSSTVNSKNPWSFPVTISAKFGGKVVTENTHYVADGWFGIEYPPKDKPRRRYFALEINHSSNVRAKNLEDASHHRKLVSLNELRLQGILEERLGTGVPVIPLFVQADENVTLNSMGLLEEISNGKGSERFCFKTIPHFKMLPVAPLPDGRTFTEPWRRVGYEPLYIGGDN